MQRNESPEAPGSWSCAVTHGDVGRWSDLEGVGAADWVIDAAASPSVRAGVDGRTTSRQVVEHNLIGIAQSARVLQSRCAGPCCSRRAASTAFARSFDGVAAWPRRGERRVCAPDVAAQVVPRRAPRAGITEPFSTAGPVSLYGATKLAPGGAIVPLSTATRLDLPVVSALSIALWRARRRGGSSGLAENRGFFVPGARLGSPAAAWPTTASTARAIRCAMRSMRQTSADLIERQHPRWFLCCRAPGPPAAAVIERDVARAAQRLVQRAFWSQVRPRRSARTAVGRSVASHGCRAATAARFRWSRA